MADRFADLDELLLLCRSAKAKRYIDEAARAYRAGAFRATIVMTWIAVVYDVVDKLRELELSGDKKAAQKLAEFDSAHKNSDLEAALRFEREIIGVARTDFELITPVEEIDLLRLRDDRNRCAHPSIVGSGDAYEPSPELARTHLRNAVEHLLQHEPVQGKAAMDRVMADVESVYFPTSREAALTILSRGPLGRPRDVLVKNWVIATLKSLLKEDLSPLQFRQRCAALSAVLELHRACTETVCREKLNELVVTLADKDLQRAVRVLAAIPGLDVFAREDARIKLSNFISSVPADSISKVWVSARKISFLEPDLLTRFKGLSLQDILAILAGSPKNLPPEVVDRIIELYEQSGSYQTARTLGSVLQHIAEQLTAAQVETVFRASANYFVRTNYSLGRVLSAMDGQTVPRDRLLELMKEHKLDETFPYLFQPIEDQEVTESSADPAPGLVDGSSDKPS